MYTSGNPTTLMALHKIRPDFMEILKNHGNTRPLFANGSAFDNLDRLFHHYLMAETNAYYARKYESSSRSSAYIPMPSTAELKKYAEEHARVIAELNLVNTRFTYDTDYAAVVTFLLERKIDLHSEYQPDKVLITASDLKGLNARRISVGVNPVKTKQAATSVPSLNPAYSKNGNLRMVARLTFQVRNHRKRKITCIKGAEYVFDGLATLNDYIKLTGRGSFVAMPSDDRSSLYHHLTSPEIRVNGDFIEGFRELVKRLGVNPDHVV